MPKYILAAGLLLPVLAACAPTTSATTPAGFIGTLPEGVAAMAAPGQDLTAVELREDDNCYWYRYVGPVETTMLPLRTVNGNPICATVEEA